MFLSQDLAIKQTVRIVLESVWHQCKMNCQI